MRNALKQNALAHHGHPVLQTLEALQSGMLTVSLPEGQKLFYNGHKPGVQAEWRIHDVRALDVIAGHGDIGLGEGYMEGLWDTPDLASLTRNLAENAEALSDHLNGKAAYRALYALKNKMRSNTASGSRKNIRAHYDLGNAFYGLWLDDTMTYSCALFGGDETKSLKVAQEDKYRRILARLKPSPEAHILEIGCGWGGFMREAAKSGRRVTGVTISPAQVDLARARLSESGLDRLTDVRQEDYRDTVGQYDHVVSIGMMEHVGEPFWSEYMRKIHAALKPAGKAMVQTIIIRDDLFNSYRRGSDFLREHIFPGGMLPSGRRFAAEAEDAGMRVNDIFRFGRDYAITLEKWLERFDGNFLDIMSLGYDEAFIRKWRFYLAGCAAMFHAGRIDVIQAELQRM